MCYSCDWQPRIVLSMVEAHTQKDENVTACNEMLGVWRIGVPVSLTWLELWLVGRVTDDVGLGVSEPERQHAQRHVGQKTLTAAENLGVRTQNGNTG